MAVYKFERKQVLPIDKDALWAFISSPANLKDITPPYMGFDIRSENLVSRMYPGMIIRYTVRPLLGIPMTWVTEITHVKEKDYFVDEQRVGPYAMWHHEHHLEAIKGGVEMTDIIHYKLPFGWLGKLVHRPLVLPRLKEIFAFRKEVLEKKFGKHTG